MSTYATKEADPALAATDGVRGPNFVNRTQNSHKS